jgi:haloacetate dehalogenase
VSVLAELFAGFAEDTVEVDGRELAFVRGGTGPALLLLHGYPQTRAAWHRVAPRLADDFTVVVPDLPGYGDSRGPDPDPRHSGHSKRAAARSMAALMGALGHDRFAVAGHDRGARVAYRLALDHPGRVARLAALDIVPTVEVADQMTYERAARMGHWFFLGQPAPLPERLIACAPDAYLEHLLESWAGRRAALAAAAVAEYRRCFRRPSVVRASCEDYRAGLGIDVEHDRADQRAGRRIAAPTLVLWGATGLAAEFGDPLAIWRRWATVVEGEELPCGHFLMEEAPNEVAARLAAFLAPGTA